MKILSIETSCDETGISILECKGARSTNSGQEFKSVTFEILANNLNSQTKIHAPYGGVYPKLAKREHLKNLPILLEQTLKKIKFKSPQGRTLRIQKGSTFSRFEKSPVDVIAVTYGPGLEPALWTGIVFAKELAKKWNVPIIPINHMEGHILSVFGKNKGKFSIPEIKFPILALLVSGGHTELVLANEWMKYKIIGETLDDAAGEAFDKVARMLGLPYPGGPEISKLAEEAREKGNQLFRGVSQTDGPRGSAPRARGDSDPEKVGFSFSLPRPMLHSKNFNFSFSGLKTAVLYLIRDLTKEDSNVLQNDKAKMQIAMEFENAVVETLVYKTKKAIEKYNIKTIIVAGGVSSNKHLKKEMKKIRNSGQKLFFPKKELSTDNSVMIGMTGYLKFLENKPARPYISGAGGGKKIKASKIKAFGGLRL
ncbi:MAG: tRNA (adenosine(37)-N6)-threonylcarbamoyltransferase complex transferase subunit TsaD [Patescibacteria group bacterium]